MTTPTERIKTLRLTDGEVPASVVYVGTYQRGAKAQYDKLLRGLVEILETPYDMSNNPVGATYSMGFVAGELAFAITLRKALTPSEELN